MDQLELLFIQDDIWYILSSQPATTTDETSALYLACEMKTNFIQEFKEQSDHVYEGRNKIITWIAKFTWNSYKQKIEHKRDYSDSMLVLNEMVTSFC